jgi:hypothetical protein
MANDVYIEVSVWLKDFTQSPENQGSNKNVLFGFKPERKLPSGVSLSNDGTIDISSAAKKFDIHFILKTKALCDQQGSNCSDYVVTFKPVVATPPYQTSSRQLMWIAPGKGPPIGEWPSMKGFSGFAHHIDSTYPRMSVSVNRDELGEDVYSYSLAVLVSKENSNFKSTLVRDDPQIKNGTTLFPQIVTGGALLVVGLLIGVLGHWHFSRGPKFTER